MSEKKTTEILKHTFNELNRIIELEQEKTGSSKAKTEKEKVIRKNAHQWESELESINE